MLKYKLILNNDEIIIYEYYPEGERFKGLVAMQKEDQDIIDFQKAENDEHGNYALHMLWQMQTFCENKEYRENGIIAWY